MSTVRQAVRPFQACLNGRGSSLAPTGAVLRAFSSSSIAAAEAETQKPSTTPEAPILDPNLVVTPREERRLVRLAKQVPIGSRRRRAALRSAGNIPFEQLPYQCFQEARKVLQEDRAEKVKQIEATRQRIAHIEAQDPAVSGGQWEKENRLRSLHHRLEELKILADINDPLVKKKFEDGDGDMTKPIYRYLADKDWRRYRRLVLMQRLTQMHVVPDVLPHIDPTAEVTLSFGRKKIPPGNFVDSRVSENPCRLKVQVFDKGERLVTVIVVDSDVPNVETDNFDHRFHYIASNIKISPTETSIPLGGVDPKTQLVLPWIPPHAQKGSPYHRLSVLVFEQKEGQVIDTESLAKDAQRAEFRTRSVATKYGLNPIGAHLFRTEWDEGTKEVMFRNDLEGWDIEFKRKKVEPLPYKKKDGARYR